MASLQWSHHDGFITMMTSSQQQKTSVQWCHCERVIIMALLQWCCHDGIITIMTSLQQQKFLYNSIIRKASSSWHH